MSSLIRALASSAKASPKPVNPKVAGPSGVPQTFHQSGSHGGGGG